MEDINEIREEFSTKIAGNIHASQIFNTNTPTISPRLSPKHKRPMYKHSDNNVIRGMSHISTENAENLKDLRK
jgi:hypothetical protein